MSVRKWRVGAGVLTLALLGACGSEGEGTATQSQAPNTVALSMGDELGKVEATESWRSSLYPENWTSDFVSEDGHRLHDFSYAGYHNGEGALGQHIVQATFDVVRDFAADSHGESDATAAIQNAIDAAQAAGGGIVYVPEGLYRLDGTLLITASNIVLRGDGPTQSQLYFTKSEGMSNKGHITVRGSSSTSLDTALVEDGASFDRYIEVADAEAFQVGDDISIGWVITTSFVDEHLMTGIWQAFNDTWQPFFLREVTQVDTQSTPHRIYVDVPLRYPAKVRDSATVRRVTGYLEEVGVEFLGLSNAVEYDEAWEQVQVHVLEMHSVKDSWVQGVSSFKSPISPTSGYGRNAHLQNSGVMVKTSKRVTVANSEMSDAQNRGGGGCGYLFEVRQSSEILTTQCTARGGRHNFIQNWGFGTTGCVWHKVHSSGGRAVEYQQANIGKLGFSEFHHSLATANLIDQSTFDDGWQIENRMNWSSGAGHTGTETMVWNVGGRGIVKSHQFGTGYVVGTGSKVKLKTKLNGYGALFSAPIDYVEGEGLGDTLVPQSLYEDQLEKRLP